jgi:hypothetical protein
VQLLYDPRDDIYHEKLGSRVLYWLDDLGALPINEADAGREAFLFAGGRPMADYRNLVAKLPLVRDRPEMQAERMTPLSRSGRTSENQQTCVYTCLSAASPPLSRP